MAKIGFDLHAEDGQPVLVGILWTTYRSNLQGPFTAGPETALESIYLNRITDSSTGSVTLNIVSLIEVQTGGLVGLANDSSLPFSARLRDTWSSTITVSAVSF